jgi:PIN domain nuclease of toxin-antitoxin system
VKCLLDTHSFIWATTDSNKLSKEATRIIENVNNEVCISVVTFWEMSVKHSVGKMNFGNLAVEDFIELAQKSKFSIVELPASVAATAHRLPWRKNHKDPFDRMLIWKAMQNNFHLVSKDSDFLLYSDLGLKLIW